MNRVGRLERYIQPCRTRPTIGLLVDTLISGYQVAVWRGIADLAREQDVNLLCFTGGGLHSADYFEAQRNVLYDLVGPANVDALVILSGTVGSLVTPQRMKAFCDRYRPLPVVSIALPLEGIHSVLLENYQGMRSAIAHLIEVHHCRRIVFFRKHEGHPEAEDRYRAYTDVLAEHGIPLNPDFTIPGDYYNDPASVVRLLLDERGLRPQVDFDALVAVDDHTALPVLQALQERGVQVPDKVAVVGFDDVAQSEYAMPPLTTVRQPLYEQGKRAAEMALALLRGETVPPQTVLHGKLIVRQSCGCLPEAVQEVEARYTERMYQVPETDPATQRERILSGIAQTLETSAAGVSWQQIEGLLDILAAEAKGKSPGAFLPALRQALLKTTLEGGDVVVWRRVLSGLYRYVSLGVQDEQVLSRVERLREQAQAMIEETAQRAQGYQRVQTEQLCWTMREADLALASACGMEGLMNMAAERLPSLGIKGCYLSLYELDSQSAETRFPTEWSRLMLAYNEEGRIPLEAEGRRFPTCQLVPEDLWPEDKRYTLIVEALYFPIQFREDQLGFVLFEASPWMEKMLEAARSGISTALREVLLLAHSAELYAEAVKARAAAEKADQLKTRLLANVSHELRNPLNVILGHAQMILQSGNPYTAELPPSPQQDVQHILNSAQQLQRMISDLLDLSRAEIGELKLYPELVEPHALLEEVFHSMADSAACRNGITWRLQLPERLPAIQADPVRLRQVLLNLLSNARKFTEWGQIVLGAEVSPPYLHIWVQDTGIGIPIAQQGRIFEPFVAAENIPRHREGIGLGLSITRRLVALHMGSMTLESNPGQGSTFHVYLPLPNMSEHPVVFSPSALPILLLISSHAEPAAEIVEFSRRQGLEIRRLQADSDVDALLEEGYPAVLALDLANASAADWALVQRLRYRPELCLAPFVLYNQKDEATLSVGLTDFVVKPVSRNTLLEAINSLCSSEVAGPILLVDDDPQALVFYQDLVARELPTCTVHTASDGQTALDIMAKEVPSLVVLDLLMPEVDGFQVLDSMRDNPPTRQVPVLILSGKILNDADVKRLEKHARVILQSKGMLCEEEIAASLHRALSGNDVLPPYTSALVKRAVAYLHQNYDRPLSRQEIAQAIGVNKDYLGRVFYRELGLSLWDYLNRYRIGHAKELLRHTSDSVTGIALRVGFNDTTYFGRVFRKIVGLSPRTYREQTD